MIRKEDNESTGLKRVIEATWEYIPQLLLWVVLGLALLIGKLWIDIHDLSIRVTDNNEMLSTTKLCEHVELCTAPISAEMKNNLNRLSLSLESQISSREATRIRLLNVEERVYSLKKEIDGYSDIESRIEFLEKKVRK